MSEPPLTFECEDDSSVTLVIRIKVSLEWFFNMAGRIRAATGFRLAKIVNPYREELPLPENNS